MRILFLIPYPRGSVPSQRFRFEQYLEILERQETELKLQSFFSPGNWPIRQDGWTQFVAIVVGLFRRGVMLFKVRSFDFIFIHRDASPLGPPFFEWVLTRVLKKKIVYDFDDAIWITDRKHESSTARWLRNRKKIARICKWSYRVSVGNEYLGDFARTYNNRVTINPTTIDVRHLHNPSLYDVGKTRAGAVITWTGSSTTLKYLIALESVLQQIEKDHPDISIQVISDENPHMKLRSMIYKSWTRENEIRDLALADIGIMPLPDDPWTRGKCGFKALQYMALELPAVVSPVGVNKQIVRHGVDGYWCENDGDWIHYLTTLITDRGLRKRMGKSGRQRVISDYSCESNTANFLSLFTLW